MLKKQKEKANSQNYIWISRGKRSNKLHWFHRACSEYTGNIRIIKWQPHCYISSPGFRVGGKYIFRGKEFLLLLFVKNKFFWAQQNLGEGTKEVWSGTAPNAPPWPRAYFVVSASWRPTERGAKRRNLKRPLRQSMRLESTGACKNTQGYPFANNIQRRRENCCNAVCSLIQRKTAMYSLIRSLPRCTLLPSTTKQLEYPPPNTRRNTISWQRLKSAHNPFRVLQSGVIQPRCWVKVQTTKQQHSRPLGGANLTKILETVGFGDFWRECSAAGAHRLYANRDVHPLALNTWVETLLTKNGTSQATCCISLCVGIAFSV